MMHWFYNMDQSMATSLNALGPKCCLRFRHCFLRTFLTFFCNALVFFGRQSNTQPEWPNKSRLHLDKVRTDSTLTYLSTCQSNKFLGIVSPHRGYSSYPEKRNNKCCETRTKCFTHIMYWEIQGIPGVPGLILQVRKWFAHFLSICHQFTVIVPPVYPTKGPYW